MIRDLLCKVAVNGYPAKAFHLDGYEFRCLA